MLTRLKNVQEYRGRKTGKLSLAIDMLKLFEDSRLHDSLDSRIFYRAFLVCVSKEKVVFVVEKVEIHTSAKNPNQQSAHFYNTCFTSRPFFLSSISSVQFLPTSTFSHLQVRTNIHLSRRLQYTKLLSSNVVNNFESFATPHHACHQSREERGSSR